MLKHKILIILLIMYLFPAYAAASTPKQHMAGFFFVERAEVASGSPFYVLVLSEIEINEAINVPIVSLGGSLKINAETSGPVLTFFTDTVCNYKPKYGIINLEYLKIPFAILTGLCVLAFFDTETKALARFYRLRRIDVLKHGIIAYMMLVCLLGVYFLSVAGALVAVLILLLLIAVSLIGQVAVAVFLGGYVRKGSYYLQFMIGIIILEGAKLIPLIGGVVSYFAIPLLSLGVFSVYMTHRFVLRDLVRFTDDEKSGFDRKRISDIVMDSIRNGEN